MMPVVRYCLGRPLWLYAMLVCVFAVSVDSKIITHQRSRYLLGLFYNGYFENYKDGIVYFDYMARHSPTDARALVHLAYSYQQLKLDQDAQQLYAQALLLDPSVASYSESIQNGRQKILITLDEGAAP